MLTASSRYGNIMIRYVGLGWEKAQYPRPQTGKSLLPNEWHLTSLVILIITLKQPFLVTASRKSFPFLFWLFPKWVEYQLKSKNPSKTIRKHNAKLVIGSTSTGINPQGFLSCPEG